MKTNDINTTTEVITIAILNAVASATGEQSAGVKTLASDQLLFVSGGENDRGW